MIKKKKPSPCLILVLVALIFSGAYVQGQSIVKNFTSQVAGTVCPNSPITYSINNPGFTLSTCQVQWTVEHGSISGGGTTKTTAIGTGISVTWNDSPGVIAKVTAKLVNCYSGLNEMTLTLSETVLSVNTTQWGAMNNTINVDFCSKQSVTVFVPPMVVPGTGGIGQPPRTEVGYAWTLPAGWQQVGTLKTGFVRTTINQIEIEPTACSVGGVVKVNGELIGLTCLSANLSATANITLKSVTPTVTVTPPAGYKGSTACDRTPVTFQANTTGCPGTYHWIVPPSWTPLTADGTSSITLRPSGTKDDAAAIQVKVDFTCGFSVTSPAYKPSFNLPSISIGASAICSGGTSVSLSNAGTNFVRWITPASMTVTSGQGTPTAVISAVQNYTYGPITVVLEGCSAVEPLSKSVWTGPPYDFNITGPTLVMPNSANAYAIQEWNNQPSFNNQGVNKVTWTFDLLATKKGWSCSVCQGYLIQVNSGTQSSWVSAHVTNSCGTADRNYEVFIQHGTCPPGTTGPGCIDPCPPGGCEEPFFVYPNPSSDELVLSSTAKQGNATAVSLIDATGTVLYSGKIQDVAPTTIPVSGFQNGVYYLSIIENGVAKKQRVVISH